MERFEAHPVWQNACSCVIIVNAAVMAIQADWSIHNLDKLAEEQFVFRFFEYFFIGFYTLELLIRLIAQRFDFFCGTDYAWNYFDMFLVTSGIHTVVERLANSGSLLEAGPLRVMRLLKTVKLLRIIRVIKAFRQLRLVLDSILGSLRSMIWSIVLILATSFMFAICFMHGVTQTLIDCSAGVGSCSNVEDLEDNWGSVGTAIISLFMATTGGSDWGDVAEPLLDVGFHYYLGFLIYIFFFLFVMMNSVTSLFVDSMRAYSEKDQKQVISNQLARKTEYMAKIGTLYHMMDNDGSGEVSYDEFLKFSEDPRMKAFASSLELEPTDLPNFFSILSAGGTKPVNIEAFVVGCMKLRGDAKAMDMMDCLILVRRLVEEQTNFKKVCSHELTTIKAILRGEGLKSASLRTNPSIKHA